LLVALAVVVGSSAFGSEGKDSFKVPGVEAQQAFDRLEERFPTQAGAGGRLVFHTDEGTLADAGPAAALAAVVAKAATGADVLSVTPPQLSPDQRTAFVAVAYDVPTPRRPSSLRSMPACRPSSTGSSPSPASPSPRARR
jgi:RND superfamily putative drug exporter